MSFKAITRHALTRMPQRLRVISVCLGALCVPLLVPCLAAAQPASCTNFTDPALNAGSSIVTAAHFNELRACINDLRTSRGLSPASWTDSPIVPGQTPVNAIHLTEMQSALTAVYTASVLTPPDFGDSPVSGVTVILAAHIASLRNAVTALPPCPNAVSPQLTNVSGTATDVVITVTTGAGCAWTPFEESEHASFESTAAVSGTGTATLHVLANETVVPRTITAVVAGTFVNVVQARAPCTFQVSPSTANVGSEATQVTFSITTNECDWTSSENSSFASLSTTEGVGNGATTLSVEANSSIQPRTVTATIAGISVSVTQAGVPCAPTLSPATVTIDHGAQNGSFGLTLPAGCAWTTSSNSAWLVPTESSGSGSGTVHFNIAANAGLERVGAIEVAGTNFAVTQTVGCNPEFTTTVLTATTASMQVTTEPGCQWQATPEWNAVSVTPSSGVGPSEAIVQIPEPTDPSFLSEIQIEHGNPPAHATGFPTIAIPCIDSRAILCLFTIVISFPGGSLLGPPQGSGPPQVPEELNVMRGGTIPVFGIIEGTGIGAQISGWTFVSDSGLQVNRTSNQGSRVWGGQMVTTGTVSLTARWQGQNYPLSTRITVTPRHGWTPFAPAAEQRQPGYTNGKYPPLNPNPPWMGESGYAQPYLEPTTEPGHVVQVTDQGPNRHLWYVTTLTSVRSFDWAIHPDYYAPSEFHQKQYGDWAGVSSCSAQGTGGNGRFIDGNVLLQGAIRHESGSINSHYADFVAALMAPATNLDTFAESYVGTANSSQSFASDFKDVLNQRVEAIYSFFSSTPEPCPQNCSADCLYWNGFTNVPPYQPPQNYW